MKLIALCGAPGSGKTEVQRYVEQHYGVRPADDGHPLREFAMTNFGLSKWHVTTQEGKATVVTIPGGRSVQVRVILGEIGNMVEAIGGPDCIPEMALNVLDRIDLEQRFNYCFGSVRRAQGHVYKRRGAKVIEIVRPGHECVNEFDQYDKSCVDLTINNDSSLEAFHARIAFHLDPWLTKGLHL
jgi:hypothetical protein